MQYQRKVPFLCHSQLSRPLRVWGGPLGPLPGPGSGSVAVLLRSESSLGETASSFCKGWLDAHVYRVCHCCCDYLMVTRINYEELMKSQPAHSSSLLKKIFLATPHGLWDLSSQTRDRTHTLRAGRAVLTTGLPGRSQQFTFYTHGSIQGTGLN